MAGEASRAILSKWNNVLGMQFVGARGRRSNKCARILTHSEFLSTFIILLLPKLERKVLPTYPSEAVSQYVHGEVAMDVTLNEDGTVQGVKVIEGNPLLNDAATDAVKQWKYRPHTVHGRPLNRIVVVLTFEKNGKVH
jgi:TonB family protein